MKKELDNLKTKQILPLLGLIALLTFNSPLLISDNGVTPTASSRWSSLQKSVDSYNLTPHEPISITSDTELAAMAVKGLGTELDPFVLEGWNITTIETHGIVISGTSKHFVIQNCWILVLYAHISALPEISTPYGEDYPTTYYGIGITNTANDTSTVQNNSCQTQGMGFGIHIWEAASTFITNNVCFNNHIGIYISYSPSSNVTNNTCFQNGIGIAITSSRYCHISHNVCNSNSLYGIKTSFSGFSIVVNNTSNQNGIGLDVYYCSSTVVVNNTFSNQTTRHGIHLGHATKCLVANNTLYQNDEDGIHLSGSSSNTICWNLIQRNQRYGIAIFGLEIHGDLCQDNILHHNNFLDNGAMSSSSQAHDKGFNNHFVWNYWSDYNGTGVYSIAGSAGTFDPYPLLQYVVSGTMIPKEADLTAPNISAVTQLPLEPDPDDSCIISTTVADDSGVKRVLLILQITNEEIMLFDEYTLEMNLTSENQYQATIGKFSNGTTVTYTIIAEDNSEFKNKAKFQNDFTIESKPSTIESSQPVTSYGLTVILCLITLIGISLITIRRRRIRKSS